MTTKQKDKPPCPHLSVSRSQQGGWVCTTSGYPECHQKFTYDDISNQATVETLDMVAGVMSAVMWDFHERAVEKYGRDVAEALKGPEGQDEAMFEYTPDICPGHEWSGGQCTLCGSSQFLGEDR